MISTPLLLPIIYSVTIESPWNDGVVYIVKICVDNHIIQPIVRYLVFKSKEWCVFERDLSVQVESD